MGVLQKTMEEEIDKFVGEWENEAGNLPSIHMDSHLINSLHWDESLRKLSPSEVIFHAVGDDGGPYSKHLTTESEQKSFDATCRKLHKFMEAQKQRKF